MPSHAVLIATEMESAVSRMKRTELFEEILSSITEQAWLDLACELHRVEHGRCDDVEAVPHVGLDGVARSRASDCAYSLNASVSGIEGSSNHNVSIPLMKARISVALMAGSKSVRYKPFR